MQFIFETRPLSSESWILILTTGLVVVLAAEVMKKILSGLR
jgi:hypothetical protein